MRKLTLIFSGALLLALTSHFTQVLAADIPSGEGYTRIANPNTNTTQLQIALRKFVPEEEKAGPTIWLAAVMHLGEPDYYTALQHFLSTQTIVLYEGINAESHPHHVHDSTNGSGAVPTAVPSPSGTNAPYSMQSTLAHSLGLVFQLDAIDYDHTNFLNSDLSIQQIQQVMASGMTLGPAGKEGGGASSPFDTLLQIMDGSSFLGSLFKWGMQFIAASPEMQAVAKLTLIEAVGRLKGDLSDVQGLPPDWKDLIKVLIEARNRNLLDDLKDELKKVPNSGSVAVFYGVGHMDDLEKRVTSELHYRPADQTWLTAFSVDLQKGGVSSAEAQMVRALVKSELDQMQAPTNSLHKTAP